MKKRIVALAVSFVLGVAPVAGCASTQSAPSQGSSSEAGVEASAEAGYSERELKLFAADKNAPNKLAVRFYNEAPNVPYIGLAHYLSLVFGDNAKVEVADGVATITSTDGGVVFVDDIADTFTTDSWSNFHNYLKPMQQGKRQGYQDLAMPFCCIDSLDYDKQSRPLTFDFSKYGINLHVDANDAYLPLATASDLMADIAFNNLAYNGQELCLLSGYDVEPQALDPAWYEPIAADEPRAQDMVDYSYGELCFVMDTMYSCSGKGILDEDIAAKGLDAALIEKDGVTQRIRDLIRSTDKADYFVGLMHLWYYVFNGHTNLFDQELLDSLSQSMEDRAIALSAELDEAFNAKDYASQVLTTKSVFDSSAENQRSKAWPDGASYREQGNTAVISLDSFMSFDRAGWEAFYAGTAGRPDGTSTPDIIGTLVSGLERAKANPEIRNVVLDLSVNIGGFNDLCATAAALITGRATTPVRDLATGQRYTITYRVDSLFDKSFKTDALANGYNFNYAVLTSYNTFSAGSYFTSLLRDAGIPVIGEVCGGGTDMVAQIISPDGQRFAVSDGFADMTSAEGEPFESGVPVDVELVSVKADGTKDYSAFYDLTRLNEVMNKLYPAA